MVADKCKKSKVAENNEEENSDHIDRDLVFSIEKLQEIQDELDKINEEASEKVLEIEQKSNVIRKPLYEKRHEIINSIPDFWVTAFLSHPALGELLTDEDQKILKYQSSLVVEDFKDVKSGYFIKFNFNPNPYFVNTHLTKSITYVDEGTLKITGTSIDWKEGKGFANGVNLEKKGNKRSAADESFFTWFNEVEQVGIESAFHDEIAEMIKDDLWSNPLKYFNIDVDEEDFAGVGGVEGQENDGSNEDEEFEDELGDEDEDEEEEEEDDDGAGNC